MASQPAFLVIDDEQASRTHLTRFFSRFGTAHAVTTAAEALPLLSSDRFSGVIMDWRLGGDDGLALLRELRRHHPHVPALFVTGYLDRACINEVHSLGADFVAKPVRPENLRAFAARVLGFADDPDVQLSAAARAHSEAHGLTAAESTLLLLALRGVPRSDLAGKLGVSDNTVKTTVRRLLQRCPAPDLDALVTGILRDLLRSRAQPSSGAP